MVFVRHRNGGWRADRCASCSPACAPDRRQHIRYPRRARPHYSGWADGLPA